MVFVYKVKGMVCFARDLMRNEELGVRSYFFWDDSDERDERDDNETRVTTFSLWSLLSLLSLPSLYYSLLIFTN